MATLVRAGSYVNEAYANWSRWVARCGLCPWATQLQRFQPWIECPLCGTVTEIVWPAAKTVEDVERLLMMRPDPSTRNWSPGEPLQQLIWENAEHGILPKIDGKPGALGMVVDDNGIRIDNLPAIKHRIRKEIS